MAYIKYYVVWVGKAPGIYDTWEECKQQIEGFAGAKYKSFTSKTQATKAFRDNYDDHIGALETLAKKVNPSTTPTFNPMSISVDAACSGNPGPMEYRGVNTDTKEEIFRVGPLPDGTNNVGEFLALVHGLALLKQRNYHLPIYTDSISAISWVRKKKCRTQLEPTPRNGKIFELIARAEKWLQENTIDVPILKWETKLWGEIPADFGRK